jgi:exosortase
MLGLTLPTILDLAKVWQPSPESTLSHGWLVFAIAIGALLRDSRHLRAIERRWIETIPALLSIAITGFLWAWARSSGIAIAEQLLWFALIGLVLAVSFGLASWRDQVGALLILLTALPIWDFIHPVLWRTSTVAVHAITTSVGIPALFDGNQIQLAAGRLEIAAGCAGMAFFATSMSFAAILAWLNRVNWRGYVVLFVAAAAMALFSNWLRISIIVYEAHRTHMKTPLIAEGHYTFGWILFAVGLLGYTFFLGNYGRARIKAKSTGERPAGGMGVQSIILTALSLGLAPLMLHLSYSPIRQSADNFELPMVGRMKRIATMPPADAYWRPQFDNADMQTMFVSADGTAWLYANRYEFQRQGHELISSANDLLPEKYWSVIRQDVYAEYQQLEVRDLNGQMWNLRYVYVCDKHLFQSRLATQVVCGLRQLLRSTRMGIVGLLVKCRVDCASEKPQIESYWRLEAHALLPQIAGRK